MFILCTFLFSCESSDDDGCGDAYIEFQNKAPFSIGLSVNGNYKTLRPDETFIKEVIPGASIHYNAVAGNHSWDNTITLQDCEIRKINLTVSN